MGVASVIDDGALRIGVSGAVIEYIITNYGYGRLKLGAEVRNFHWGWTTAAAPSTAADLINVSG